MLDGTLQADLNWLFFNIDTPVKGDLLHSPLTLSLSSFINLESGPEENLYTLW